MAFVPAVVAVGELAAGLSAAEFAALAAGELTWAELGYLFGGFTSFFATTVGGITYIASKPGSTGEWDLLNSDRWFKPAVEFVSSGIDRLRGKYHTVE